MSLQNLSGARFGGLSIYERSLGRGPQAPFYTPGSWADRDSDGGRIWRSDRIVLSSWGTEVRGVWVDRRAFNTCVEAEEYVQRTLECSTDEARAFVGALPVRFK